MSDTEGMDSTDERCDDVCILEEVAKWRVVLAVLCGYRWGSNQAKIQEVGTFQITWQRSEQKIHFYFPYVYLSEVFTTVKGSI